MSTEAETQAHPQSVLEAGVIYAADNGRLICRECAGISASLSGRDISGQAVQPVPRAENPAWKAEFGENMACEDGCTSYEA